VLYIGARAHEHYATYGVPDARLVFSPYCVDTAAFRTDEAARASERGAMRASLGFDDQTLVLLQSGKLTPKKRPDLLLEAVRALPSRLGRQVAVVLVGDGELRAELERTAATLDGVRVHVTGFRNQRELSPYYHAADVAVLPSQHSETWGLVVNEAFAHGLPCVVSSVVGCGPDLVRAGTTGDVFEVGSATALAEALVRVQPLVGQTSTRERCRALAQCYSVEAAAAGIAAAYREVVRA
jgi:glycosyltransferase involved in cell wall biosynthesis